MKSISWTPIATAALAICLGAFLTGIAAAAPSAGSAAAAPAAPATAERPTDPGWPRMFSSDKFKLTVYQPQVDKWDDHKVLHFRCAILVEGVLDEGKFGVAEIDAATRVDQQSRVVELLTTKRELRFAGASDEEMAALSAAVDELRPQDQPMTASLDRILACLEPNTAGAQKKVDVSIDPPKIFHSGKPAVLVVFLGEPEFKPVVADNPDLMFAVNTNWDIFLDASGPHYYLLIQDHWLTADAPAGPWKATTALPAGLAKLPADDNWAEVRKNIPAKKSAKAETVFVSNEPAELILTTGEPTYAPISGTRLLRISNSESPLFRDAAAKKLYFMVAGRWFRADSLDGPWSAASNDLPEDFARIPDGSTAAWVKSAVPGTPDAQDAVMLAAVPVSNTVDLSETPKLEVLYKGDPKFVAIEGTTMQYAANSPYTVLMVDGKYYCCDQGVWLTSVAATGPWSYCTKVPETIYQMPVSSPVYNVTYVTVKETAPKEVVYEQTSCYSGEYVAANGVLMFGAGLIAGALIADSHHYDCYPWPHYYSYGCGAVYHYGYGGYYCAARGAYGPYGGVCYTAAYNPVTGVYSRGAYAYGPYGSAGYRQAYNPYTGTYAAAGYRATPYGTAAAGRVYNPYTGATAAGGRISTAYGSAGRMAAYNPSTGNAVKAGYKTGPGGSVAGVRTNQGTGAVGWDNARGQGGVVKTRNDNIYAGHDGNVYKRDSDGNWSQVNGDGNKNKPQPKTTSTGKGQPKPATNDINSQAKPATMDNKPATRPTTTDLKPTTADNRPQLKPTTADNKAQLKPATTDNRPQLKPATTDARPQVKQTPSFNRQELDSQMSARQRGNQQTQMSQSWQNSASRTRASSGGSLSNGGSAGGRAVGGRRR